MDDREIRGPSPRLYFPKLFNWIRYDTAKEIKEDHPKVWEKIYSQTKYSEQIFSQKTKPHFSQPTIYNHHFLLINKQYEELKQLNIEQRIDFLQNKIKLANTLYNELESVGIVFFDNNCRGDHLPTWNRLINKLKTHL